MRPRKPNGILTALRAVVLLITLAASFGASAESDVNPLYLPEEEQRAWKTQLEQAEARIEAARREFQAFQTAYAKAQREEHPRGEARAELIARREAAHEALTEATAALPGLIESARRAGVYPEVLRPFRDRLDELTRLPAAPADS